MKDFEGKTALISGGAEGIGLSIAQALGKQGMQIVLGDIDAAQLAIAHKVLEEQGVAVLSVVMDVTLPEDWQRCAEQAIARFGKIHMLVNNAGVSNSTGPLDQVNDKDWRWVNDVNLNGVLFGARAIVPLMKQQGEGGWLINVASMAGMMGVPYASAYTATKNAVVALSEGWHQELRRQQIHVSVLCPAFVKTRIHLSERNRQAVYQSTDEKVAPSATQLAAAAHMKSVVENGLAVEIVGERVVEALRAGELYIFTHPNYRALVQQRYQAIDAAFERAAASPLLAHMLDEEIVGIS
jgi:NAD(P)-dependent dehydrogenase (short-subunit alcohol dehydrogenase family)